MALVSSASRRERKIGQVRVLGFSSAMSLLESGMCRLLLVQVFHLMRKEDEISGLRLHFTAAEARERRT